MDQFVLANLPDTIMARCNNSYFPYLLRPEIITIRNLQVHVDAFYPPRTAAKVEVQVQVQVER